MTTKRNHIKAYVRALPNGTADEWAASIQCHAVEVDGVRVPGTVIGVGLSELSGANDVHFVTVKLAVSKFETVDVKEMVDP